MNATRTWQGRAMFIGAPIYSSEPRGAGHSDIDFVKMSNDGKNATKKTSDALKLSHMPTCEVFANWPTRTTPLEGCNHGSHERCASAAGRVRATVRRLFWPSSLTC